MSEPPLHEPMSDEGVEAVPGAARCPGISWDEMAQRDTNPVPAFLEENAYRYMGSQPLATARYTSPEFFRSEIERM